MSALRFIHTKRDLARHHMIRTTRDVRHNEVMDFAEFRRILTMLDCYWQRKHDQGAPHVRLSSGLHSDLFVNLAVALTYPLFVEECAWGIYHKVREHDKGDVDWVIGSDHTGANLAYEIGRLFGARTDFTEKRVEIKDGKTFKYQDWKRHRIGEKERVLIVEELTTTSGTIQQMVDGITRGTPHKVKLVPVIPVIVDRTGVPNLRVNNLPIRGLFTYPANQWPEDNCPFCKCGSPLIESPRTSWQELMAHCA